MSSPFQAVAVCGAAATVPAYPGEVVLCHVEAGLPHAAHTARTTTYITVTWSNKEADAHE